MVCNWFNVLCLVHRVLCRELSFCLILEAAQCFLCLQNCNIGTSTCNTAAGTRHSFNQAAVFLPQLCKHQDLFTVCETFDMLNMKLYYN